MTEYLNDVTLFHKTFNSPAPSKPTLFPHDDLIENAKLHELRVELLREEVKELDDALRDFDIVEVADALADIAYVTFGAAVAFGINLDEVFDEVQRSNMSKLDENGNPIFRADGKILKSKLYSPPDIAPIIARQKGEEDIAS